MGRISLGCSSEEVLPADHAESRRKGIMQVSVLTFDIHPGVLGHSLRPHHRRMSMKPVHVVHVVHLGDLLVAPSCRAIA